ncbi:MAG: SPFH domain-containing protein [Chloroflexi bacterium]|nr:MAG: SPFH domain-containing protein [Chloroflexota bacterium]
MMLANVIIVLVSVVTAAIFVLAPGWWWLAGSAVFVLAWAMFAFMSVPYKDVSNRGMWAIASWGAMLAGLISTVMMVVFQVRDVPIVLTAESLQPINYAGARIAAMLGGGVLLTLPVMLVFLLAVGYFSSLYVLALHESEGLTFWQGFKSFFLLITDFTLTWQVVENGQITDIKKQGYTNKWLSRGKIFVKPGNAIITERGGKITGIHGPGVVQTVKNEMIRTVFDLRKQSVTQVVENVITADRIPLTIEMGIVYQITPADPVTPGVLKESKFGVFPVDIQTLTKAGFNGTSGGWKGFGDNVPVGRLRDQVMAHQLDELFDFNVTAGTLSARVNSRKIKEIEDAILAEINSFADDGMGITYGNIDIREISLPKDVRDAVHTRLKSEAEAEAIQRIEGQRNTTRGGLVRAILNGMAAAGVTIGPAQLQLATEFARITRRALADDVLGHQYIDMLTKIAEGDASKIFNITPEPTTVDLENVPWLGSNGNGHNGNGGN